MLNKTGIAANTFPLLEFRAAVAAGPKIAFLHFYVRFCASSLTFTVALN